MKALALSLLLLPSLSFAETFTFSCDYPRRSSKEGIHEVKTQFNLTFIVDKDSNKAIMLGNNGSVEVIMLQSTEQSAFIEVTESGSMITTAIDHDLNSVHSRNTVIAGELVPSQYYGKCEVK